ncbi:signal peptidase I [Peptoniphilus sp. GNH]|nr:signal peptidase I [Peptoniphilus sp. GNH]
MKRKRIINIIILSLTILLSIFIKNYVFSFVKVSGTSMYPTIKDGQVLIVNKAYTRLLKRTLRRGEIIVVRPKDTDENLIKRLIGLPGDFIEIKDGELYINGTLQAETYVDKTFNDDKFLCEKTKISLDEYKELHSSIIGRYYKRRLKDDEYFFMGDNRLNSTDSRMIGPVSYDDVLGLVKKK